MVCLADGIQRHEWQWLREWWDRGFGPVPQRVRGATVVWSDRALEAQLDDFITTRCWTTHKLLHELLARKAPVFCAADVTHLDAVSGPLLVLNPRLFPSAELARVLSYRGGPVVLIGPKPDDLPPPAVGFSVGEGLTAMWCGVYGATPSVSAPEPAETPPALPEDLMGLPEPPVYVQELAFQPIPSAFLATCAETITECARAPLVMSGGEVIQVHTLELTPGHLRLILGNDSHYYTITEVDVRDPIDRIERVTPFPGTPPAPRGSQFTCRVPGKGAVILDIFLTDVQT
jgi:hypothetical protein